MSAPVILVQMAFSATEVNQVDVTPWLTGQIALSRGRSRETDQFAAGRLTYTLRNEDRRFDPNNAASPYAPWMIPGIFVFVFLGGKLIFIGQVDDWDLGYIKPNIATVTIHCSDGLTGVAQAAVYGYSAAAQDSLSRAQAIVTRPEVTPNCSIGLLTPWPSTSYAQLRANTFDNLLALDLLKTTAISEGGFFFCRADGFLLLTYRNYLHDQRVNFPAGQIAFSDSGVAPGGPFGYVDVGMISGNTLLFNRVTGQRSGGVPQRVDDSASQSKYHIRTLSLAALENDTDADAGILCSFWLALYKDPLERVDTLTVELSALSAADQATLAQVELLTLASIDFHPPGGGSAISQLCAVEKLDYSLDVSASSYRMTIGFMNMANVP